MPNPLVQRKINSRKAPDSEAHCREQPKPRKRPKNARPERIALRSATPPSDSDQEPEESKVPEKSMQLKVVQPTVSSAKELLSKKRGGKSAACRAGRGF